MKRRKQSVDFGMNTELQTSNNQHLFKLSNLIHENHMTLVMNIFVFVLIKKILFEFTNIFIDGIFYYILYFEFDIYKLNFDVTKYFAHIMKFCHILFENIKLYKT